MIWKQAHRLGMLAAGRLHRELNTDQSIRVDVFAVIEQMGLLLAFRPLSRMSGAYVYNEGGTSGVVINSNEPAPRQRYTAAHELGHHVFGHGTAVDMTSDTQHLRLAGVRSDREKLAEAFAEWFLMPRVLIESELGRNRRQKRLTPVDVYTLSLRLGTSYDATARHLVNLRMASPEELRAWLAVPRRRIKESLALGLTLQDWHRDVWQITERDRGATLVVNAGDPVVAALEEVPTSGYLWEWQLSPPVEAAADGYVGGERGQGRVSDTIAVGGPAIHWFALDVGATEQLEQLRIDFAKRRHWVPDDARDSFDLRLRVERKRLGVREELLALAGE